MRIVRAAARIFLAAAAGWMLAAAPAPADVVELVGGGEPLEGQVLSRRCPDCGGSGRSPEGKACRTCGGLGTAEASIRVRVRAGAVELPRAQVKSITWKPFDERDLQNAPEAYRAAAAKLDPADARGQFELGNWCLKNGLLPEARRHLSAAAALDGKLARPSEPLLAEAARRTEEAAVKALLGALAALPRQSPAEAAAALRGFQKTWADTEIARRQELQRDLIRKQFPELAAGGDTVEVLARAAEDKAASACPDCGGSGRGPCAVCKGSGQGSCPDCGGKGQAACPVCAGTALLTCRACWGSGKARSGLVLGYSSDERPCPVCRGAREVPCDVCAGTGRRSCKRCGGAGKLAGACGACGGKGTGVCAACGGAGVKPVGGFVWGPPPVRQPGMVNVVAPGDRVRAWQGESAGGVITVVGAEALYRGSLSRIVELAAGARLRVVCVALDNRKGTRALPLRAADKPLRAVTGPGAQLEMLDLAAKLSGAAGAQARAAAEHAGDAECLPGAYRCALAAFPENADLENATALFWAPAGAGEPVKLSPIWLTDEEVGELRRSLREK